jgi:hypothetical protein
MLEAQHRRAKLADLLVETKGQFQALGGRQFPQRLDLSLPELFFRGSQILLILSAFLFRREFDSKVAQLPRINVAGRLGHKVGAAIVLRKGDDFANAFFAADHHHNAIQPKCDAAVGRGAQVKRAQKMSEK